MREGRGAGQAPGEGMGRNDMRKTKRAGKRKREGAGVGWNDTIGGGSCYFVWTQALRIV